MKTLLSLEMQALMLLSAYSVKLKPKLTLVVLAET